MCPDSSTLDGAIAGADLPVPLGAWVELLGKESIEAHDSPASPPPGSEWRTRRAAMRMVEAGVASVGDIDRGIVLGDCFPVGLLELTDRVGLNVRLAIAEQLARRPRRL